MRDLWKRLNQAFEDKSGQRIEWAPPASMEKIEAFEQQVRRTFPADFKALLALCGGSDSTYLVAPWYFCEFSIIEEQWSTWSRWVHEEGGDAELEFELESGEPAPDHGIRTATGSSGWVPFVYNGSGDFHCVDLDPGEGGVSGQVISIFHDQDYDTWRLLARSVTHYLEQIVVALENGQLTWDSEREGFKPSGEPATRLFYC